MNFARRPFLAVLAFLCCSLYAFNAGAAPYPNEQQLRTALAEAARLLEPEGLALEVVEGKKAGVNLPLLSAGLNVKTGACVVFYNTEPEQELRKFFAKIDDDKMPIWLNSIAVHEATHCVEQREAYLRNQFDKVLPPSIERANMTVQGYLSVVKSGAVHTWGEALADIASLLYLKQAEPNDWETYAKGIATMRHDLSWKWPAHDTSPWLNRLIAANPKQPAGQSLFETAFQLRRQFQPK
jgi:hypothetical protein